MNGILSGGVRDEFPHIKSKCLFDARLLGGELHSLEKVWCQGFNPQFFPDLHSGAFCLKNRRLVVR